ncbi:hypothetical protein I7I53_09985 [Histoplasma capsulatum var. duboisii H88]|uniref:Uncharacterized protein n=1 Tax=Ajellomyces capsulatus (strain H88) TaxID=544711 RepID=A0A8A1LCU5_AJEC8|nr:hypothetical protein I7I53_09985 [Histoplasma capsulatum var. duboisii H88]
MQGTRSGGILTPARDPDLKEIVPKSVLYNLPLPPFPKGRHRRAVETLCEGHIDSLALNRISGPSIYRKN